MNAYSAPTAAALAPPFEVISPDAPGPALLVCDHASNTVPQEVNGGDLGLSAADMNRHIAFDVGAAGVTRRLSVEMNAPAVMSRFSRLVIDPNRGEDDPTLLMKLYDGSIIPANRYADSAEIARRLEAYYTPYHTAVTGQIDRMIAAGTTPQLISVHSYTPQLRGKAMRPWHVGILWDKDGRLAQPLIERLQAEPDLVIGDNEPYSGQLQGDSMYRHGTQRGLPHVLIEIRNDLIAEPRDQAAWAARLAPIFWDLVPATAKG